MKKSQYLINKCENISTTLNFFRGVNTHVSGKERRMVFLAQLDYWDWEMDELIFSFETFDERAKAWKARGLRNGITKQGFMIQESVLRNIEHDRRWYDDHIEVISPWEDLNKVITQWNELLSFCEDTLFDKNGSKKVEKFGMIAVINLDKYQKKLIDLKEKES